MHAHVAFVCVLCSSAICRWLPSRFDVYVTSLGPRLSSFSPFALLPWMHAAAAAAAATTTATTTTATSQYWQTFQLRKVFRATGRVAEAFLRALQAFLCRYLCPFVSERPCLFLQPFSTPPFTASTTILRSLLLLLLPTPLPLLQSFSVKFGEPQASSQSRVSPLLR
jgi:hypothetical protein